MATGSINKPRMVVESVTYSTSLTLESGSYSQISVSCGKTGYTPVGVLTFTGNGTSIFSLGDYKFTDTTTLKVFVWNNFSSSRTADSLNFNILYVAD